MTGTTCSLKTVCLKLHAGIIEVSSSQFLKHSVTGERDFILEKSG